MAESVEPVVEWFTGSIVEVCARRAFITCPDLQKTVRITAFSRVLSKKKTYQAMREMTNDVSDYICIGDRVRFQVEKKGKLAASVVEVQEYSETAFQEIHGVVKSVGKDYGVVSTQVYGKLRRLQFRDQNCATPRAVSLKEWFQPDTIVFMRLNPASRDPKRIIISVRPVYEAYAKIIRVIESINSVYATSAQGEVFLPFSKLDLTQEKLVDITGERYNEHEVHFWAYPNYQTYTNVSPWLANRWHLRRDCEKYDYDDNVDIECDDSTKSSAKCENFVTSEKRLNMVEVAVQTELECYNIQNEEAEDFLTPLRLPKVFQQSREENSESEEKVNDETIEFAKEFGIVIMNDKKFYNYLKSDHEEFLTTALKLASKYYQLMRQ